METKNYEKNEQAGRSSTIGTMCSMEIMSYYNNRPEVLRVTGIQYDGRDKGLKVALAKVDKTDEDRSRSGNGWIRWRNLRPGAYLARGVLNSGGEINTIPFHINDQGLVKKFNHVLNAAKLVMPEAYAEALFAKKSAEEEEERKNNEKRTRVAELRARLLPIVLVEREIFSSIPLPDDTRLKFGVSEDELDSVFHLDLDDDSRYIKRALAFIISSNIYPRISVSSLDYSEKDSPSEILEKAKGKLAERVAKEKTIAEEKLAVRERMLKEARGTAKKESLAPLTGSAKQKQWAAILRQSMLQKIADPVLKQYAGKNIRSSSFWIENRSNQNLDNVIAKLYKETEKEAEKPEHDPHKRG